MITYKCPTNTSTLQIPMRTQRCKYPTGTPPTPTSALQVPNKYFTSTLQDKYPQALYIQVPVRSMPCCPTARLSDAYHFSSTTAMPTSRIAKSPQGHDTSPVHCGNPTYDLVSDKRFAPRAVRSKSVMLPQGLSPPEAASGSLQKRDAARRGAAASSRRCQQRVNLGSHIRPKQLNI